jgi:hypothetical protein
MKYRLRNIDQISPKPPEKSIVFEEVSATFGRYLIVRYLGVPAIQKYRPNIASKKNQQDGPEST